MKKIIPLTCAMICAFSALSPVSAVFAASSGASASSDASTTSKTNDSSTDAMKKALETVKSRVKIPDEYSEFSYSKSTRKAITTYTFTWTKKDDSSDYIIVDIEGNVITRYQNAGNYNWDYVGFPKLSDSALKAKVKAKLKELNPDYGSQFEIEDIDTDLRGENVYVRFSRKVNGLDFNQNDGMAYINKNTGEISQINLDLWDDAEFTDSSKVVDKSVMEKSYKDNVALTPQYVIHSEYDKETESYVKSANIIYSPDKTNVLFDAATGKLSTIADDYAVANNTSNYNLYSTVDNGIVTEEAEEVLEEDIIEDAADVDSSGSVALTESEKNALLESEKYLSQKKTVDLLLKDKYLGLTEDYVLSYAIFGISDTAPSGYVWSMNFYVNTSETYKAMEVTADAETGKILYFSKWGGSESKKLINVKTVNKIAEKAAKYYISDIFDEYKADEDNTKAADKETSRTINYTRYVNDLPVSGDDISIKVNSNGEVTYFSYNYTDVKFPSANIISSDKAYEKLFEQTDFNVYYDGFLMLDGKSKTYMLFTHDTNYINAKTGKLCSYDGSELEVLESDTGCPYTDIDGHWAQKYIEKLYDYGVRLSTDNGTEFNPDEYITDKEFAGLLDNIFYTNIMPILYENDGYTRATSDEYGNDPMTNESAAKQFVICAGGDEFANIKGIYKSPFKDVSDSDKNAGYISLAYGMGAVKADKNGNFNPEKKVTRGYAMYMIYNYLSNYNK